MSSPIATALLARVTDVRCITGCITGRLDVPSWHFLSVLSVLVLSITDMSGSMSPNVRDRDARTDAWDLLRRWLRPPRISLYPLEPYPLEPYPPGRRPAGVRLACPAVCALCRGPVRPGFARCYQCARHDLLGPDLLADAVVPISYAVKGTAFAASLWRYKSWPAPSAAAQTSMLALLLAFLHDHGSCVWRQAGMPAPGRLAVVPTGCGRPGPHPLLALSAPYLRLPVTRLVIRPGEQGRDPNPNRFSAERTAAGSQCAAARGHLGIGRQRPVRRRRAQAGGCPPRGGRGARPSRRPGGPSWAARWPPGSPRPPTTRPTVPYTPKPEPGTCCSLMGVKGAAALYQFLSVH